MEIKEDHVEWVTVDRLGKMLKEPSNAPYGYDVTYSFAIFSAIFIWIRLKLGRYDSKGCRPKSFNKLNNIITTEPWKLEKEMLSGSISLKKQTLR